MIFIAYSLALVLLAALPTLLVIRNLQLFRTLPPGKEVAAAPGLLPAVSVLIPARNEASGIAAAVGSVLANTGCQLEVIVLDDHSSDQTYDIVANLAKQDSRVAVRRSEELPEGWNGKQFACWQLAGHATHPLLLFLDADVRLSTDAVARLAAAMHSGDLAERNVALLSGFPRQITETFAEKLLIPMMHFVLLGYLPLEQMRSSNKAEFGAGCGQLFLARKSEYFSMDGHRAIAVSRHDGLKLPRAFRAAGLATDLFDASDIAQVRMYDGTQAVTRGLLKNATEGIANRKLIGVFSVLLLGASVLPIFSLAHAVFYGWPLIDRGRLIATLLFAVATLLSFAPRWLIANRLNQSMLGVVLHPLAVLWFIALQWIAFVREQLGFSAIAWRDRT